MKKILQRDIKKIIRERKASLLDNVADIPRSYNVISVSAGVYGMNGAIIMDNSTKKLWAIPARNSMLFRVI